MSCIIVWEHLEQCIKVVESNCQKCSKFRLIIIIYVGAQFPKCLLIPLHSDPGLAIIPSLEKPQLMELQLHQQFLIDKTLRIFAHFHHKVMRVQHIEHNRPSQVICLNHSSNCNHFNFHIHPHMELSA